MAAALIPRQAEPPNLESPVEALGGLLTPPGLHFVRSHFPVPSIDPRRFTLRLGGCVSQGLALTLDDLRALPSVTRRLTLECAGNGRAHLPWDAAGLQWEEGAVGTADWTGVPLGVLLDRAGVGVAASHVLLQGADRGEMEEPVPSGGVIPFARSLPLPEARNALLAWEMNGGTLPALHGGPLRAVVPGCYGMASVKWLERVEVLDRPWQGYFETVDYARWEEREGLPPERVPLGPMRIKAQIVRPAPGAVLPVGEPARIEGAAWCGTGTPARVEVSTDGGATWHEADWTTAAEPGLWRLWALDWAPLRPGPARLLVRATSSEGETQPEIPDPRRGGYEISHPVPVVITVAEP
ncbi:molybdopterin-dependent oxidoreductase [Paracoccus sp. S-4012]|nr:molybdopterin-dependent oxidoreductase [Paracoccus sp. S-4012]